MRAERLKGALRGVGQPVYVGMLLRSPHSDGRGVPVSKSSTTERTQPRKEFQVKIVKVDRESVLRQADVF